MTISCNGRVSAVTTTSRPSVLIVDRPAQCGHRPSPALIVGITASLKTLHSCIGGVAISPRGRRRFFSEENSIIEQQERLARVLQTRPRFPRGALCVKPY